MNKPLNNAAFKPAKNEPRLSSRALREAQNSLEMTLTNLRSDTQGLTHAEAAIRLQEKGANEVAHDKRPHALIQLLQAFNNPFIIVLMVLAAISAVTDIWLPMRDGKHDDVDYTGVSIIVTMVVLSGLLRFWQEYRSGKAAEALKAMVRTTATVLRRRAKSANPERNEIPMRDLVPGDIVTLSAGDMIPADIRLIESRDLYVSQAVLTGEALPVEKYDTLGSVAEKSAHAVASSEANMLDLPNITIIKFTLVAEVSVFCAFDTFALKKAFSLATRVLSRGTISIPHIRA